MNDTSPLHSTFLYSIPLFLFGLMLYPSAGHAQLISPGKLSKAHSFLNGISNCVQCHEIRNPSISVDLCLDCHVPVDSTMAQMRGVHGQPAVIDQNCSNCHQEHFGEEFDVLRFDSVGFDHDITGFALTGAHEDAVCQDCHGNGDWIRDQTVLDYQERFGLVGSHNTFLGLDETCASCHLEESVHGDQFADQSCASCHTTEEWADISGFDHDRARFQLTGLHTDVACESCHATVVQEVDEELVEIVKFQGLAFERCEDCHEDVHEGRLDVLWVDGGVDGGADSNGTDGQGDVTVDGGVAAGQAAVAVELTCESCHLTEGWHQFDEAFPEDLFPHEETGYALLGAHQTLSCESCHTLREDLVIANEWKAGTEMYSYPEPVSETCMDCHVDYHEGVFVHSGRDADCASCHTLTGWVPSDFGLAAHQERSRFQLTGSHIVTPCSACHVSEVSELTGEEKPVFAFDDLSCEGCHEEDNPHGESVAFRGERGDDGGDHGSGDLNGVRSDGDRNGRDGSYPWDDVGGGCDACHSTASWNQDIQFDHEAQTGYALTGAHAEVRCSSCHFDGAGVADMSGADMTGSDTDAYAGGTDADMAPESDTSLRDTGIQDRLNLVFGPLSDDCMSCHQADSPHQGQFAESVMGPSCDACHTTERFTLDRFDHSRTSFPLDGAHIEVACADCHTQERSPDGTLFTRFFPLESECSACHGN